MQYIGIHTQTQTHTPYNSQLYSESHALFTLMVKNGHLSKVL